MRRMGGTVNDFEKARKNLETIEQLEAEIVKLKADNSKLLEAVKKERGVSFKDGAKFYSIRCRAGNNFLVSSDVAFGSWLKKDKAAE